MATLYIFNNCLENVIIVSKGETLFMATCYANQLLKEQGIETFEFQTYEGIELDNDMNFGVTYSAIKGKSDNYSSENLYYKESS